MKIAGAFAAFKRRAYLLIVVDPGSEAGIIRKLENMNNIKYVDFVHGDYDIVCVLEGGYSEIDETVIKVRKIPRIRKTITLTAFETHLE